MVLEAGASATPCFKEAILHSEWMIAAVLGTTYIGVGLYFWFRNKAKPVKPPVQKNISQSPEGFLLLAGDALRNRKLVPAREFAETGLRLNPDDKRTHSSLLNILGNVAAEEKSPDKALKYFLEAVKIDPSFAFPHNNLGNLYFMSKDFDQAEKAYLTALKLKPEYSDAQSNLTRLNQVTKKI